MDGFRYNFSARRKGKGWQLVMDYKDETGWHQKTKAGFERKQDALSYRQTLLAVVKKTAKIDVRMKGMTLMQFTDMYLNTRNDLSFGTKRIYRDTISRMYDIKDMPIDRIKYIDAENQIASLTHLKPGTIKSYRVILKAILSSAVRFKAIPENPIAGMKTSGESSKEEKRLRVFTKDEVQYFIDHILDNKFHLILGICATTGVRIGEALGITWPDVDFVNSEIRINKQYKRIGRKNGKVILGFGAVKNKNGNRTVHMPPVLRNALIAWREKSPICLDRRLTNIRYPAMLNFIIQKKFPGHSVHDFRHTFATTMLASGTDVRTVAALLGDTLATIESTYLHYTEDMRRAAASKVDQLFG